MADVKILPVIGQHIEMDGIEHVITRVEWTDGTVWKYRNHMPYPIEGSKPKIIAHYAGTRRAWRAENIEPTSIPCGMCNGHGFLNEEIVHVLITRECPTCHGSGNELLAEVIADG